MSKSIYNPCVVIPCWSEGPSTLKITGACGYNEKQQHHAGISFHSNNCRDWQTSMGTEFSFVYASSFSELNLQHSMIM